MAGFNFVPPILPLAPAELVQLGLGAFRPPPVMSMPPLPSAPLSAAPSLGGAGGGQMLSAILDVLKGKGGNAGGIVNFEEALPDFLTGAPLPLLAGFL